MNLIELQRSLRQLRLGGMAAVLETRLIPLAGFEVSPIGRFSGVPRGHSSQCRRRHSAPGRPQRQQRSSSAWPLCAVDGSGNPPCSASYGSSTQVGLRRSSGGRRNGLDMTSEADHTERFGRHVSQRPRVGAVHRTIHPRKQQEPVPI
jgi:hypothetical protein